MSSLKPPCHHETPGGWIPQAVVDPAGGSGRRTPVPAYPRALARVPPSPWPSKHKEILVFLVSLYPLCTPVPSPVSPRLRAAAPSLKPWLARQLTFDQGGDVVSEEVGFNLDCGREASISEGNQSAVVVQA